MSTEEQFAARLRRLGGDIAPTTTPDPDALAATAVRRVRRRRAVGSIAGTAAAVAVVATLAFTLPDAGPASLPGGSASAVVTPATASPSAGPEGFVYEAQAVPEGWRSIGIAGLALAVPEAWEGGAATWNEGEWWDQASREASDNVTHEIAAAVGTAEPALDADTPVVESRDLSVPGADVARMVLGSDDTQGGYSLQVVVHQPEGLWYEFRSRLPGGDDGLRMAETIAASLTFVASGPEILATLPRLDHLPYLEVEQGVPARWVQRDMHGLSFALPPEYTSEGNSRGFTADDPRAAALEVPDAVAPGVPARVTVIWNEHDYLPSADAEPGTKQLRIDGTDLATVHWGDSGGNEPGEAVISVGRAVVERADGSGYYTVDWTLPGGSDAMIEQFLGTLQVS